MKWFRKKESESQNGKNGDVLSPDAAEEEPVLPAMRFKEIFCLILACYQAFFPVFISLLAGLLGAFLLLRLFLG